MNQHRLDRPLRWRAAAAVALAVGGLLLAPSTGDALAVSTAGDDLELASVVAERPRRRGGPPGPPRRRGLGRGLARRHRRRHPGLARHAGRRRPGRGPSTGCAPAPPSGPSPRTARLQLQALGLTPTAIGPTGTAGDMTNVAKLTGATTFWRNGYSGQGVDVALLDSGVLPVEGLMTPNKLVIGPDLSLESQSPTLRGPRHLRSRHAHGRHHRRPRLRARRPRRTRPTTPTSSAWRPARGSSASSWPTRRATPTCRRSSPRIDWVVTHAHDTGLNIRVLNLSFGTDSTQDYRLDPLAHAAEVAWNSGIVVVVSAGNGGGTTTGLANPAYDPAVLAVGAVDTQGTSRPHRRPGARVLAARRHPRGQARPRPGRARRPRSSACGRPARSSTSCTATPGR